MSRLKELRVTNGWSQQYVADKCHMSRSQYGRRERDETALTAGDLKELSKLYNCDVKYFILD